MEKSKKTRRLSIAILLMSGGGILGVTNLLSHYIEISDFTRGFFGGVSIALSVFGLIYFIIYLIKYRKF